jgi:phosphate transport system protein
MIDMDSPDSQTRQGFVRGLQHEVLEMARLAGDLLHRAVHALNTNDNAIAASVIEDDDRVDAQHLALEQQVIALLGTQQPLAGDLRTLASILAISIELERFADHAESIAEASTRLGGRRSIAPMIEISYMAQIVRGMLHDVVEAFARRDPLLAEAVAAKDDTVDAMREQMLRELPVYVSENPRVLPQTLDLVLVAQHLERAADHVTNIAERVVYMATGEMRDLNPEAVHDARQS